MIFRSRRFRKLVALLIAFSFTAICLAEPDAEAILHAARVNPLGQSISLKAQLRTDSATTPFQIVVDDAVRYRFENPEQELILELHDDSSSLSERVGGKTAPVRPARFDDPVRGAGITYEDLSLRFLYWKNPKLLGEETIRSRKAWKIELQAARASSQYRRRAALDRPGERRPAPHRRLQQGRQIVSPLRSHLRAKDRRPVDAQANAGGNR